MNTLNSVYETINKLSDKTELAKHEVELALLDDLLNLNREAGSLLVLQKFQTGAYTQLQKSLELNKKGLVQAEKGLKAAQDLGVQDGIDTFKRWIKSFTDDIKRAEKGQKIIAELSNI